MNKKIQNYFTIIALTLLTFAWTYWIFDFNKNKRFHPEDFTQVVAFVIAARMLASTLILNDFSSSWSKATQKTFLIKGAVYLAAFVIYIPFYYGKIPISFFVSELFIYLFSINFLMYSYYFFANRSTVTKTKEVVIYGAGKAGLKLKEEFGNSAYKIRYFIDDDTALQNRSIDGIRIISKDEFKQKIKNKKLDLLVIAMPSAPPTRVKAVYDRLHDYFDEIQVLPPIHTILRDQPFAGQLKDVSVADLLARHPQDLDKEKISSFIKDKIILITGAGGSIGSEIVRQCIQFEAKQIILLDHSEFNLYQIDQETEGKTSIVPILHTIVNRERLFKTFAAYKPQIVIHAAAYKHVPMVEANPESAIHTNIMGTKNCIDAAIQSGVEKFILISTDKAVRPTNVMGTTKRICELYAQNVRSKSTEIVAVRFGNVLGSSGSVIPKFKTQIDAGGPITVTHPEITRYFMLIPEACELVLQAGAIGKGGEIFILDMGKPIKIVDLAKKMIELSGRDDIEIVYTGLRPGEKLYEELLIDESDMHTQYRSITVAAPTHYDIDKLNEDISSLVAMTESKDLIAKLKEIVPEFHHMPNR